MATAALSEHSHVEISGGSLQGSGSGLSSYEGGGITGSRINMQRVSLLRVQQGLASRAGELSKTGHQKSAAAPPAGQGFMYENVAYNEQGRWDAYSEAEEYEQ